VSRMRAQAQTSGNRLAPFLLVGAMARLVPGSTRRARSRRAQVVGKVLPQRAVSLDWSALDELHDQLVELVPPSPALPTTT
jgi:hypothetical protein